MDEKEKALAVGHIPSGLFVVAIKDGENKDGYLASWVQQVSFKPLLVSLAISPSRPGYEGIVSGKTFTINIVGDNETQYMRHFWSGYETSPFGDIAHDISENGGIIMKEAKSTIECKFISKSQPGDHEIVIAEVIGSYVNNEDAKPKIHIRKSGLDY